MSTRHQFQFSGNRKKIDAQSTDYAVSSSHSENNSLKSDSVCDLRKSLAWDSSFFTSPGVLDPEELFGTLNIQFLDDEDEIAQGRSRKSLKLEVPETDRISATRSSSVRKSLAWDSAFLTCEGVLNAEELSIVNSGFRKPEMQVVPETIEELWRSGESNGSSSRDDYSLSSLEVDLFDDMRSSSPNFVESIASHKHAGEKRLHNGLTARKPAASRLVKNRDGVSCSLPSLKPPKVSGPANPLPRAPKNRTSLGANKASMAPRRASSQKSTLVTKKTGLRDSLCTVSTSTPSTKSPPVVHSAKKELAGFSGRKSGNPLRRTDSQLVSSVLSSRTPPKVPARNRSDSASLMSTPKSSSGASSISSVDGFLSDLSASSVDWRLNKHDPSFGYENREEGFKSPLFNRVSGGSGASPVSPLTDLKTSALRMPSPKIGFFDTLSPTGFPSKEHQKFQSGSQQNSEIGTGGRCVGAAANRTRNRNPVLMEKLSGSMSRSREDKVRVSSSEKVPRDASRQITDKKIEKSEEENKENDGRLENQVDVLIKRMDAVGLCKRKSPLSTRNRKH